MKILHIASIGLGAEGIGTVISKIVPEQIKIGHDVKILSVCENLIYHNLNILHIKKISSFIHLLNEWMPDIVHFHSVYRFPFIFFYKELKKKNIPYVVQMHGALSEENYRKNNLKKAVANFLFFNSYLRNAESIFFLNNHEFEKCVVKNLAKNVHILPNGCEKVKNVFLKEKSSNPVDIIFIGRIFMIHKGIDVLCDAIDILMKDNEKSFTISFYANPNDEDLNLLLDRIDNYSDTIKYKGGIYGLDKESRLKEADLFILTSRYEGMPMGILEALSYGIPVVITPGTNMGDVVSQHQAGWVAEFNPESVAAAIRAAVKEMKNRPLSYRKNAHKLSLEYDWNKIAKQSIEIYNNIIKCISTRRKNLR